MWVGILATLWECISTNQKAEIPFEKDDQWTTECRKPCKSQSLKHSKIIIKYFLGETYYATCNIDGKKLNHGDRSPQVSPCRMFECQKGVLKDISQQVFGKINKTLILNIFQLWNLLSGRIPPDDFTYHAGIGCYKALRGLASHEVAEQTCQTEYSAELLNLDPQTLSLHGSIGKCLFFIRYYNLCYF